jgi:hypothetical protein
MFANTKPQTTVSAAEMLARAGAVRIYIYIYIYQIVAPLRARVAIVAGQAVPRFPGYRPQGRPDSQKRGRFVFGGGLLAQERRRSCDGGNFIRSHMLLTCR